MGVLNLILPRGFFFSVALLILHPTNAFYLPGVTPTSYKEGSLVPLSVNRLTPLESDNDPQLRSTVSYDYYHPLLHFCQPEDGPKDSGQESLGSVIFGDRIYTSPFELKMLEEGGKCKFLCGEQKFDAPSAKFTNKRILENYALNWLIDGLPAGQPYQIGGEGPSFRRRGFPLGSHDEPDSQPQLHNHFDIAIDYHDDGESQYRVVGVSVYPYSRKDNQNQCGSVSSPPLVLNQEGETSVTWTYRVMWQKSDVKWALRWDTFLHVDDPNIHWFSLVSYAVVVVLLASIVSTILMTALKRDFARYNRLDSFNLDDFSTSAVAEDGVQEDSGWKLVHGDVFRPPKYLLLLSVFVGNGAQLFFMTGITLVFALFGFLSPSARGSLGTAMIILYTVFGFISGYVSSRVYKTFGGEAWKKNIALTPLLTPAIVFGTFFFLNFFLWVRGSSGAVPFSTMLVVVGLWFLISVPLSFAGSWAGFKQPVIQPPVRTNQIPRQIPPSRYYLRPIPAMLLVGALPFGAISVELNFIMGSLWFNRIYYMFGFLFLCYGIMIITCASVTIMFVYYLLCSENYRWQWRAFASAGTSAFFVLMFALGYGIVHLRFSGLTSMVLFLGYSTLISFLFALLTGTIGYFSSWAFVHRIYGSIRID